MPDIAFRKMTTKEKIIAIDKVIDGCASSSTGTLFAIESSLKEKLDDKIRVLPI